MTSNPNWHLLTEWFKPKSPEREAEFIQCLEENLASPHIQFVHLFCEGSKPPIGNHTKLIFLELESRPTYADLIQYSNKIGKDEHVVIANNDISFIAFQNFILNPNEVACTTRHDASPNGPIWYRDVHQRDPKISQDAWFFSTPLCLKGGDFYMGTQGCDNRIAWLFYESGNRIFNNGRDAIILHRHKDQARNYTLDRLPNPYAHPRENGTVEFICKLTSYPRRQNVPLLEWDLLRSMTQSRAEFWFTWKLILRKGLTKLRFNTMRTTEN